MGNNIESNEVGKQIHVLHDERTRHEKYIRDLVHERGDALLEANGSTPLFVLIVEHHSAAKGDHLLELASDVDPILSYGALSVLRKHQYTTLRAIQVGR